ncbi:MAG: SpoIIIAC/SpoIIIAD family protein [Pseudoflavonifractor sp.]
MTDILKIAAIAIISALCAVAVKKNLPELGLVLALAAGLVILSMAMGALQGVRSLLDLLAETAGLAPAILAPILKTMGIAIVTRIAAEICRDAKESGIAAFVETAGAAAALFVAIPLLRAVLDMVTGLL